MSTRMMSFITPPAASTRCLILVNVALAWPYIEPSPSTPPAPSLAVMPATKIWLPSTRQFDQVPGGASFTCGLVTRCIFMASPPGPENTASGRRHRLDAPLVQLADVLAGQIGHAQDPVTADRLADE